MEARAATASAASPKPPPPWAKDAKPEEPAWKKEAAARAAASPQP